MACRWRRQPASAEGSLTFPGGGIALMQPHALLSQEVERCRGALKFCSFLHPLSASPHLDNRSAPSRKSTVWSCASHGKAHSATPTRQQSPRVRLFVRVRVRVRLSVECVFSYLGKRSVTSRKDTLCFCDLTKKRIPQPQRYDTPQPQRYEKAHFGSLAQATRHQKAHSATPGPPGPRFSVTRGAAKGRRLRCVPPPTDPRICGEEMQGRGGERASNFLS